MNPALVQDLFSEYPPTSLTIFEDVEGTDRLASSLRLKEETGNLFLGGVEYTRYDSSVLGPNGNPNSTVLVFDPEADGVVPRHWVSCRGLGYIDEGRIMTCYVSVPKGSVIGQLMFIGSKERGFEFTKHFADFAQDIVKTLDAANVTLKLEYYSTFTRPELAIVEWCRPVLHILREALHQAGKWPGWAECYR